MLQYMPNELRSWFLVSTKFHGSTNDHSYKDHWVWLCLWYWTKGKAFNWAVNLHSNSCLCSWALGSNQVTKISLLCTVARLYLGAGSRATPQCPKELANMVWASDKNASWFPLFVNTLGCPWMSWKVLLGRGMSGIPWFSLLLQCPNPR